MKIILTSVLTAALSITCSQAAVYISTDFESESQTALSTTTNSTEFINTANNTANVVIISNISGGPTGQHLQITGNADKHITMETGMSLLTDGATSLSITFAYRLNDAEANIGNNIGRVLYSESGNFGDAVEVASYTANTDGFGSWNFESLTLTSSDVTFSDTAKIRFAQGGGGNNNTRFQLDDITIASIPEPSSLMMLGLGTILMALRRRR